MKQRFIQISLFLLLLTSWSCKKEDMFLDRLEGTWNIDRLERYEIHPDGSAITLTDEKNVGTLSMKVATIDGLTLDNLKDFEFNYTENGNAVNQIGVLKVDEQAKRVIILGATAFSATSPTQWR